MADVNVDTDYSEYEAMEAEAEGIAAQPIGNAPIQRRPAPQMNEQDVEYSDEVVDEEIEAAPAPKPIQRAKPHTSNMNARDRKPIPIVNPGAIRQVEEKSTEQELEELEAEEAAISAGSEANQLATEEKMPRWMPFHQPEKIGLVNTQTREVIEGFKDEGSAAGMAKILNEIDSMITGGGYQ